MKKTGLLVLTIAQIAALTIMMILTAAPFVLHQQEGASQGQQQQEKLYFITIASKTN